MFLSSNPFRLAIWNNDVLGMFSTAPHKMSLAPNVPLLPILPSLFRQPSHDQPRSVGPVLNCDLLPFSAIARPLHPVPRVLNLERIRIPVWVSPVRVHFVYPSSDSFRRTTR